MGGIGTVAAAAVGIGAAIKGISSIFGGSSSSSSGYTPRASVTAAHAKSNADLLAELKAEVRDKTEKQEKEILDYIDGFMAELLVSLEQINQQDFGGKKLNINVKEIKNKNDALKKEVVGFVGNYMDDRLVLKDLELDKILKEKNDKKRKQKFDTFYKKLLEQATDKLKTKIESTVHKQEEVIRKAINNRLSEVDESMERASAAYEEILHMKEKQDDSGMEEKQIQYCYQYGLTDILLGQLES